MRADTVPPLRIGLLGTGRIGRVHAAGIAACREAVLARVCDPVAAAAESVAEEYASIPATDPAEVVAAADVDALWIAAPTSMHAELIGAAVAAGKPVFCEKPIDLDLDRTDALGRQVADSGGIVMVGFNRRFDPHFAEVRKRVSAGEIGRLEQLVITSRDPTPPPVSYLATSGGIFRDMAIHDLDMARFFVPEIVEVTALGARQFSPEIAAGGDFDAAVLLLRGAGDELITIINSRHCAAGYDQRLEAHGPDGMLRAENLAETTVRAYRADGVERLGGYRNFFLERYAESYRGELAAFIDAARHRTPPIPGFADGRAALALAEAAVESVRTKRAVRPRS